MKSAFSIKTIFLLSLIVLTIIARAQHTKLPPFRMLQANNQVFSAEQLPFGKPIVLIYFLPDCDHCQLLTENIVKHIKEFDKASIAMVTYYPTMEVGSFAKKYGLNKYSNFYLGTEGDTFFLKRYYNLSRLPFMALYTKNGDLVKMYYTEDGFSDLLNRVKKL